MTVGVAYIARRQYIINTSLPGFSGQYDEILHSSAAFSLVYGSGKYSCTLVQYLTILPTKAGNKIYERHGHIYVPTRNREKHVLYLI